MGNEKHEAQSAREGLNGATQPRTHQAGSTNAADDGAHEQAPQPCTRDPYALNLERGRRDALRALVRLQDEAWDGGDDSYSNSSIARRCGVTESVVRRWASGEKPIPIGVLAVSSVPQALREDLAEGLLSGVRNVASDARSVVNLGRAVMRLEAHATALVATDERRRALARSIRRFAAQLEAAAEGLEGE